MAIIKRALLSVTDIAAVAELAHSRGALLSVDNSMMSPYLQNPLDHGADIVIHSATKFLCGHSDVTAGVVAVKNPKLAGDIYLIQNGAQIGFNEFRWDEEIAPVVRVLAVDGMPGKMISLVFVVWRRVG